MSYAPDSSVILAWGASPQDARGQMIDRAAEVTGIIRDLVRCSAFALCAWDPLARTHRHLTLASDGYSDAVLAHVNDEFVRSNPAFMIAHRDEPRALRWRDYEKDWDLWFQDTPTARDYLIPSGFSEGSTMCLRLPDGRYCGAIHVSWTSPAAATDERREITERFRPILAEVCDQLRMPHLLAETLPVNAHALVISANGAAFSLKARAPGVHLAPDGALRRLLLDTASTWSARRFLWCDDRGQCHRVTLIPCLRGVVLVSEEQIEWPHDLSWREIQVLHLVSTGASNPQIANQLCVAPRTVSTHVEHILAKMECVSRTALAARAVAEGLLLPRDPGNRDRR